MTERYDWLLFDADDTLYDFQASEQTALRDTFQHCFGRIEPGWLTEYHRINQGLFRRLERGEISATDLRERRFRDWLDHHALVADPHRLGHDYLERLSEQAQLLDDAEATIAALHGRFKLAIVTNGFSRTQRRRYALSPLHRYFDALFISEEIGCAKPHAGFFDHVFAQIGRPARERVMIIGDNPDTDIAGGLAYGIDSCWLNRHGLPHQHVPSHEILALAELPALLERLRNA
jgi:YjjG family noncanonical pyrimidine nucleotidase